MAVFTKLSSQEINKILSTYNFGKLKKFSGIKEGIENTNYLIQTTRGKAILTIFEKRVRKKDVPFFVKLMAQLNNNGFKCPKPFINKQGRSIFKIKNKLSILVSFVDGKGKKILSNRDIQNLGKQIAKFHKLTAKFKINRRDTLSYQTWIKIFKKIKWDKSKEKIEVKQYLEFYKKNKPKKLTKGIIHGDLFPDNIFFKKNIFSGLIDFYFSYNGSYLYELAVMINALCFGDKKVNIKKTTDLINNYKKNNKIINSEFKYINVVCLGAAIRFYLTRKYDQKNTPKGAHIKKKDPKEYLNKMRYFYNNFHLKIYD